MIREAYQRDPPDRWELIDDYRSNVHPNPSMEVILDTFEPDELYLDVQGFHRYLRTVDEDVKIWSTSGRMPLSTKALFERLGIDVVGPGVDGWVY